MYMFTESLFCICLQTWRGCIATTFILLITIITTIIISITKLILQNALVIVTSISSFVTSRFTYKLKETKLILKVNTVNCASVQYLTIRVGYRPQKTRAIANSSNSLQIFQIFQKTF